MSCALDFEQLAVVRVLRDRFSGDYVLHCDFDVHAECTKPMDTVDGAFELAKRIVQDEVCSRKTIEVPPVVGTGSDGNDG